MIGTEMNLLIDFMELVLHKTYNKFLPFNDYLMRNCTFVGYSRISYNSVILQLE
jgi:hypothetical protein